MDGTRKKKIADASGLPRDVLLGCPVLTAIGMEELCIENYRGIIEYSEEVVRIQTKTGQIKITGTKLHIDYYSNDEMKIEGNITGIEYRK